MNKNKNGKYLESIYGVLCLFNGCMAMVDFTFLYLFKKKLLFLYENKLDDSCLFIRNYYEHVYET